MANRRCGADVYEGLRVAAVLPAYNESSYIEGAVAMLPSDIFDDVIVVDDATTDGTGTLAETAGATSVVTHEVNRGVGAAMITGFKEAMARGNDVSVIIPGDGQADVPAVPALLDRVIEGYGLVISDRLTGRDPLQWGMPKYRVLGSRALSMMTWIATGIRVPDPQSGFKAVTTDTLRAIPLDDLVQRWGIHNDMISYCAVLKIPVTTVLAEPVYQDAEGDRITSHIKLWDLIPRHLALFVRMLRRRVSSWFRRPIRST